MTVLELDTPHGPARAHLQPVDEPLGAVMLGHGAGGGVQARDIATAATAANASGFSVALIEQPYRVAGRRSPAPAAQLDAAWIATAEQLKHGPFEGLPLITGGRSAGARVACRTAQETDSTGVLCLAFPLHPPQRKNATGERPTRIDELDLVHVPTLVVQGVNDRFGMPPEGRNRIVARIKGDHRLQSDLGALSQAVDAWLPQVLRTWAATRA